MPARSQTHYFGAGPAPLPTSVLETASSALLNYENLGIGIAEMSHRSPQANSVLASAKAAMTTLLDIPTDDYEILFLQGGGSGEFSAVVYHMVGVWVEERRVECEERWHREGKGLGEAEKLEELRQVVREGLRLDYLVTGSWSLKASQEAARLVGPEYINVAIDARKHHGGKFGMIPDESAWKLSLPTPKEGKAYAPALTYYCDNETVDGVEFPSFPASLVPSGDSNKPTRHVVADMSSNFLSRAIDVKNYSIIFGGAQKNLGIPGVTIVIIRKSLLGGTASPTLLRQLHLPVGPIVLDFPTIAKNNSLYNTLPIFDVWVAGQVMQRLLEIHGDRKIAGQEAVSNEKAKLIYATLDKYAKVYTVVPDRAARSRMNICLRINDGDADKEKKFLSGAEELGLTGLKGHRSVGGIRISNYNAVPLEAVHKLVEYLEAFAQR